MAQLLHVFPVEADDGGHPRGIHFTGLLHQLAPAANQPEDVLEVYGARRGPGGVLAQRETGGGGTLGAFIPESLLEIGEGRQRGDENGGLPAPSVIPGRFPYPSPRTAPPVQERGMLTSCCILPKKN